MKKKLLAGLSVAALSVFGLATSLMPTSPAPAANDYETLPAKPDAMARTLTNAKVTLSQAIAVAETATTGHAAEARAAGKNYIVDTYGDQGHVRATVSMETGKITGVEELQWINLGEPVVTDWTTTDSGLMYAEITEGTGDTPPDSSARVTVHYSGWLLDGTKFDSSVDRGQPATFPLNGVIKGWTEGVGSMKVGGKRKLTIPYMKAYGEAGAGGAIPPKADLIFEIDLLGVS